MLVAANFLQILLDLTVEEALITKYGYRYKTPPGRWGRLRRLYSRGLVLKALGGVDRRCS